MVTHRLPCVIFESYSQSYEPIDLFLSEVLSHWPTLISYIVLLRSLITDL